jgi:uroporphyrinogen decarboxylase
MNSRQRVLKALELDAPDRVPWVETYVDPHLASQLLHRPVHVASGVSVPPEVLEVLNLDNVTYGLRPPEFVRHQEVDGVNYVAEGLLKTKDDLGKVVLPDPEDESLYEPAVNFLKRHKGEYLALASMRFGVATTYLSMGIEHFSLALYEDLDLVTTLLDMFSDWSAQVAKHVHKLGFDAIIVADDLAFKTGPMFSPQIVRELFLPRMKKVAENFKLPWIYHTDGNVMPLMNDLLTLDMNGIANIESGAMDIHKMKKDYGARVCLMGNIDLHYTLTRGSPEETEAETRERIQSIGRGGGYILASANSLTRYCKPENVLAMNRALLKYGNYPL